MTGLAVDQQAALLAEGCLTAGDAKCTYGTGAFLLVTTGARAAGPVDARAVRLGGLAARRGGDVLPGRSGVHGGFGGALADRDRGCSTGRPTLDARAGRVPDTGGVTFVPALAGLGAPYWAPDARGALHRAARWPPPAGTSCGPSSRASPPRSRCWSRPRSRDLGRPLTALRVDGGLTRSRLLMQAQADLLQVPVEVCRVAGRHRARRRRAGPAGPGRRRSAAEAVTGAG